MNTKNDILKYIQQNAAIPTMPQVITRLQEITADPDYGIDEVINLLSSDAGIASDVLRLANSPLFGVAREVSSLLQATNLLGIKRIRTLVLGKCMVESVNQFRDCGVDISYFWRRSLATAVLSAHFAEHIAPKNRDTAFMSGLLSDVGVVVLARALPEQYAPIAKKYAPKCNGDMIRQETECVGISHAQVSALVLEQWSLPELITEAVRYHHTPSATDIEPKEAADLARIVGGSAGIARLLCESSEQMDVVAPCEEAMQTIGLSINTLVDVLQAIEHEVSELATILRIDVIPSRVYEIIAKSIAEKLAVTH